MNDTDVDRFVEHLRTTVGTDLPEWPGGWPGEIECALLDAAFSIRARYGGPASGVRAVVNRWRAHRSGVADDLKHLAAVDGSEIALIVDNHAKANSRLKAEIVSDAAAALLDAGVHSSADFTGSSDQKAAYLSTKGCGPVTWAYFGMLLGRPDVKADTWLLRFVRDALQRPTTSPEETRQLVIAAAEIYGVSASRLDHAIWRHARNTSVL